MLCYTFGPGYGSSAWRSQVPFGTYETSVRPDLVFKTQEEMRKDAHYTDESVILPVTVVGEEAPDRKVKVRQAGCPILTPGLIRAEKRLLAWEAAVRNKA